MELQLDGELGSQTQAKGNYAVQIQNADSAQPNGVLHVTVVSASIASPDIQGAIEPYIVLDFKGTKV